MAFYGIFPTKFSNSDELILTPLINMLHKTVILQDIQGTFMSNYI